MPSARVRRRVHVRDEADNGTCVICHLTFAICLQRRHDIPVLIERHVLQTDGLEFVRQVLSKLQLSGRGRRHAGILIARRAEGDVF